MEIAHAITELDGRFVEADAAFCNLLHVSKSELFQQTILDVTCEEDRAHNGQKLHDLCEKGQCFVIDKRYVRSDGMLIPVQNHVSRILDLRGRPRIVATVIRRPQLAIEQMLRAANARAGSIREQSELLKGLIGGTPK